MKYKFLIIPLTIWLLLNVNAFDINKKTKLEDIAMLLTLEQSASSFKNYNEAKAFSDIYDTAIMEKFNLLSTEEKYQVLDIIKYNDKYKKTEIQTQDLIIDSVIEDLRRKNIFSWDVNEIEFKKLLTDKANNLWVQNLLTCSAELKNFPWKIYYSEKPSHKVNLHAFYFNNVKTDPNEYPCDTELWYNYSYTNVWGTTAITRLMITSWYGGALSTKDAWLGRLSLVIWTKAALFWLTDVGLYNNVVLWQ